MMGAVRIATTSLTRAGRPAAALALGALVLTGCSGGLSGSTAAVVDGRVISVDQLQEVTAEFNALPVTPTSPTDVLTLLIYSDVAADAYAAAGNPPVSDAQLVTQLQGGGVAQPSEDLVDLFRTVTHLQGAGAVPSTEGVEIEVNPRFGGWDAEVGQVMAQTPAWITEIGAAGSEVQN